MHKKLFYILLFILPVVGLGSCNDDDLLEGTMSMEGDVPVMFSFEEPVDGLSTRGTDEYKQLFEENDVIHVQGTFKSKTGETGTAYGAMILKGRKWVPIEGSTLYWPYDAVSGTFKAYYVYNSDYTLNKGESTLPVNLSDVLDYQDPLEAVSDELLYGFAVNMQFTHACTYLTIEKMEPNVTDYYWMVFPGDKKIKNAYQLSLSRSGELTLDFISVEDPAENNLVYISRRSESMVDETDGQAYSMASFYLAPGDYYYFDLRTNSNFPFMSFLNSLTAPLEANHPYTLNVVNAKGANFVTDTELDWDDTGEPWQVDVKEFLKAANEGREYSENDGSVPILKKVNGSLVLVRNLDFNFFDDYNYDEWGFFPDLSTPFDGNLHYIENLGHPLFRFNYSTIQNLGLKTMRSTVVSYEGPADNNYAEDASRVGGLCMWNRSSGNIHNVRLENFDITVRVQASDPQVTGSNETFNVGSLCGENLGTISDVALKGDFNLTVEPYGGSEYPYLDATVYIGGIVGNLAVSMTNVGPQLGDDFKIKIINNSYGNPNWGSGVFCVGGAIGNSTANEISQVVINDVKIIGTASDGYQQYTGGLAGRLRGNGGTISNCTVQGSLTCGTVSAFGLTAIAPSSYMGGIAGNVRGYTVTNCRAVCDVTSNTNNLDSQALYATGGAFGRIQSGSELRNNSAYGNVLTGPAEYIGTFAGVSRSEIPWSLLSSNGNTARSFGTMPQIATTIDGNDTE